MGATCSFLLLLGNFSISSPKNTGSSAQRVIRLHCLQCSLHPPHFSSRWLKESCFFHPGIVMAISLTASSEIFKSTLDHVMLMLQTFTGLPPLSKKHKTFYSLNPSYQILILTYYFKSTSSHFLQISYNSQMSKNVFIYYKCFNI